MQTTANFRVSVSHDNEVIRNFNISLIIYWNGYLPLTCMIYVNNNVIITDPNYNAIEVNVVRREEDLQDLYF